MLCRLFMSLVLVVGLAGCGGDSGETDPQTGPCDDVYEGDYTVLNQNDIDTIAGYCKITGKLIVVETELTSFSLPKLASVGALWVASNEALVSFSLPALRSASGGILSDNKNFELTTVSIKDNDALTSFSLPVLTSVGGRLGVGYSKVLTSFELPSLTEVGDLGVSFNDILTTFSVPTLTSVDLDLIVFYNDALTSFSAPNLASIGRDLKTINNDLLSSFSLPALNSVGDNLTVRDNTNLAQCLADALVAQIQAGEGIGDTISFCDLQCTTGPSTNNTNCTCSEVDGVLEATCS